MSGAQFPLCIDMDETLIHADVLYLGIKKLAFTKPWLLVWFIFWLIIRRAAAKAWLAKEFPLEASTLSYRGELVEYLKEQKKTGRKIYLVSAGDEHNVKAVAKYMDLFDGAYGSDGNINLKGTRKAQFIMDRIAKDFVYAGDSFADLKVWKYAAGAILCGKAVYFKNSMTIPVEAVFA